MKNTISIDSLFGQPTRTGKLVAMAVFASLVMGGCKKSYDTSSPKATMKSFTAAIESGADAAALRQIVDGSDASLNAMVLLSRMELSRTQYNAQLARAFNPDKQFSDVSPKTAAGFSEIDAAKEVDDGDTATLTLRGSKQPVRFKKVGSSWKITGSDSELPDAADIKFVQFAMEIYTTETASVAAGKYASQSDAALMLAAKLHSLDVPPIAGNPAADAKPIWGRWRPQESGGMFTTTSWQMSEHDLVDLGLNKHYQVSYNNLDARSMIIKPEGEAVMACFVIDGNRMQLEYGAPLPLSVLMVRITDSSEK